MPERAHALVQDQTDARTDRHCARCPAVGNTPGRRRRGERIGLVNRLVPAGQALAAAQQLDSELAALAQTCLHRDRASALDQHVLNDTNVWRPSSATAKSAWQPRHCTGHAASPTVPAATVLPQPPGHNSQAAQAGTAGHDRPTGHNPPRTCHGRKLGKRWRTPSRRPSKDLQPDGVTSARRSSRSGVSSPEKTPSGLGKG
jgi:hypothetical protein